MTLVDVEFEMPSPDYPIRILLDILQSEVPTRVERGLYCNVDINPEFFLSDAKKCIAFSENIPKGIYNYGIADTVEQIKAHCYDVLDNDSHNWFITYQIIYKEDQVKEGGWRWRKWGEYIGDYKPQCEYLYDEPYIDKVILFHVYEVIE